MMRAIVVGAAAALSVALVPGCGAPAPRPAAVAPPIVITSGHEPPPGTPFSRYEHYDHLGLLQANGFTDQRSTWWVAAGHGEAAIRAAACALLAEAPRAEERGTLEAAARDPSALVRAWALLGLVRLGDTSRIAELRALASAARDPAALAAAGLLARLGDGSGAPALDAAMKDRDTRLAAIHWLFDLAHAAPDRAWPLFSFALSDPSPVIRALALSQLEELRDPRSRPILEQAAAAGPGDPAEHQRIQALLASLPAP